MTPSYGAPLFPGPALDREWDRRLDDLARAVDRLGVISSQDALILLRSSFSAPKVLHLLRCSPSTGHPALERFDSLLRRSIQNITNSDPGKILRRSSQGNPSVGGLNLSLIHI